MSDEPRRGLERLLAEVRPRTILALGPGADRPFQPYLGEHPDCQMDHVASVTGVDDLSGCGRYDLASVSEVLEHLDKTAGEHVIARLRDVHAPRVLLRVAIDNAAGWRAHDFFAHGFVQLAGSRKREGGQRLYGFDLDTYKTTPDWLNSRHWAHPELFDRSWW